MTPYRDYSEKRRMLESGELSLVENVERFLERIEERRSLNAFTRVFPEESIEAARRVEKKIADGNAGKLAGMVVAVKDVLAERGRPNTCCSKTLEDFVAVYDAAPVKRLLEEDAILVGRTNCDEFSMGGSNENSAFGPARNPIDETRVPGGSSGGSAAAAAAWLCDVAIGADTGGSIRQPAAYCGVYGLKPTYSRVSRYGLTAFASSFDSVGPMARNVEDVAIALGVIAGFDAHDATSADIPVPNYVEEIGKDAGGLKIGLPKEYFADGLNAEVRAAIEGAAKEMEKLGAEVVEVSAPHTDYAIATYYLLTTAEASSNLARYDGMRYGKRAEGARDLAETYRRSRTEGFGEEVKRRIMLGTFALSAGYYDAYYGKAQKARRLVRDDFKRAFEKVDLLVAPSAPTTAFKLGEKIDDPLEMYLQDVYTTPASLAGCPGVNVPVGTDAEGLPIGLQVIGDHFDEAGVLRLAKIIGERAGGARSSAD
jgi:aspartyl-tRNA(Asn)/glutamyl-tRNA(Gln) amidotransferase subunit A